MNVKQLFEMCDKDKLVKSYLSLLDTEECEKKQEEKEFINFYYKVMKIRPCIDNNMILLLSDYIDDQISYIDVTLYNISEIEKNFKFCKEYDSCDDIKMLTDDDIKIIQKSGYNMRGYAFALAKWEEVLGYSIDVENIMAYGLEKAAAAILYEITYFGYDQEKITDIIDEIDAADKKLYDFKNNTDFESIKCLTFKDVTEQLEIKDSRTSAEIENDNRQITFEHTCNCISAYRAIKKFYIKKFNDCSTNDNIISV